MKKLCVLVVMCMVILLGCGTYPKISTIEHFPEEEVQQMMGVGWCGRWVAYTIRANPHYGILYIEYFPEEEIITILGKGRSDFNHPFSYWLAFMTERTSLQQIFDLTETGYNDLLKEFKRRIDGLITQHWEYEPTGNEIRKDLLPPQYRKEAGK